MMEKVKAAINPDTALEELWRRRALGHIGICLRAHCQGLAAAEGMRSRVADMRCMRRQDGQHNLQINTEQLQARLEVA